MEITRLLVAEPPVAKVIHTLQLESYQREASLIEYPHLPPLRESFEDVVNFHGMVYGVQRKDALLGVIFVEPAKEETTATITKLFVAENEERKGIGRSLVTFVKTRYDTLYVSTAERNEPAIRLYQKLGFNEKSRIVIDPWLTLCTFEWKKRSDTDVFTV